MRAPGLEVFPGVIDDLHQTSGSKRTDPPESSGNSPGTVTAIPASDR